MEYGERTVDFIKQFNEYARDPDNAPSEYFETCELDMAKALMYDFPVSSVRIAKIILAIKDVSDVKVKII